jgi:single-strand DNA-binding protein
MNKVILAGALGQDPEKRVTQNGASIVNVNLATNEFEKKQDGGYEKKAEWHKLVIIGKAADKVEQYCKKGSKIIVEGKNQTRNYIDKEGQKRYITEVVCFLVEFLDSKGSQGQSNQNSYPTDNTPPGGGGFVEDDILF